MRHIVTLSSLFLLPGLALAQAPVDQTAPPPPPPIVAAPPGDVPQAPPAQAAPPPNQQQPTPPPPGYNPPVTNPGYNPQYPGYQPYFGMPYGQPAPKPSGPEIGLMITEGAFGMLTAGAEVLLPFLLLDVLSQGGGFDPTLMNILIIGILVAEPLAVSQTVLGIANSSRYYYSESWPAMLTGLGAEAAIIGLIFLVGSNSTTSGLDQLLPFLVASVIIVPLAEVVVINLTKGPKSRMFGALNFSSDGGFYAGIPMPLPYVAPTSQGMSVGVTLPMFAGRF